MYYLRHVVVHARLGVYAGGASRRVSESLRVKKKKNERRAKDETPASDEPNRRARAGEDGFRCAAFRGRGVRPPRVRRRRDRASRCAGRGKRRRPRTAGVRRTRRDHLHHGHGVRRARGGVLRARRAESEGASRLARLDAQLAAARGVREVEAGDFGGDFGGSRSDPCAVGDVVSLIRRGPRRRHRRRHARGCEARQLPRALVPRAERHVHVPPRGGRTAAARAAAPGPEARLEARGPPRGNASGGGARGRTRRSSRLSRLTARLLRGSPRAVGARVGGPVGGDVARVGRSRRRCLVDDV